MPCAQYCVFYQYILQIMIKCFPCTRHRAEFSLILDVASGVKLLASSKGETKNKPRKIKETMIGKMTKKAWEFTRINGKTHDNVWTEGQGKLHSQAKVRN